MQLPSYPEYKDSDVPWLGKIPKHWGQKKVKYLFNERIQKGFPLEPLLAATQRHGVIFKHDYKTRTVTAQKDLHLLKLVEIGDFIISLRSFQGGIEYAFCRGIISPAYTVMSPHSFINAHYFRYLAKSKPFLSLLRMCVTGIREGQNIDYERLRKESLPTPTLEEQKKIGLFLNWKTSQINKFIRNKRRLIALLKEQKQNVINKAVTRGLDPDVKLKPSGVDWIGYIPEHWDITKLKYLIKMQSGTNLTSEHISTDGQYPVYGGNGIRGYYNKYNSAGNFLLIGRQGALCGNIHQVTGRFWATEHAVVVITHDNCLIDWCYFMLQAMNLNQYSVAAAQPGLAVEKIAKIKTALPPIEEQRAITDFIFASIAPIDSAISRAEREIELITEYRDRLIADVVTGKVDVRGVEVPELNSEEPDNMSDEMDDPEELDNELASMVEEEEDA